MLNRSQIKLDVKAYIKGKWFMAFLTFLLVGAVIGFAYQYLFMVPYIGMMSSWGVGMMSSMSYGMSAPSIESILPMIVFASLIYLIMFFVILAALPLFISLESYFLRLARGENPHLDDVITPLQKRYFTYLGTALWRALWIALWSALLWVPGIIKSIAYSFTPYIIYENPKIGALRALKLSMIITNGHKWDLFVLWLSFIGWNLLAFITAGLLSVYVQPYYKTTYAVYYEKLKEMAIAEGKIDPAEFVVMQ